MDEEPENLHPLVEELLRENEDQNAFIGRLKSKITQILVILDPEERSFGLEDDLDTIRVLIKMLDFISECRRSEVYYLLGKESK